MTAASTYLAGQMSEEQLLNGVKGVCKLYGWLLYHPYDSRRSTSGYPDLTLVHPRGGVLFRELKKESGRVSPAQKEWLSALMSAGADADLWWPRDWYSGRIQRELQVFSRA